MSDVLSFLEEEEQPVTPEPEPAPEPEAQPEGPERGPDGRFLPKEKEPEPQAQPEPEPAPEAVTPPAPPAPEPQQPAQQPGFVPIAAMLDERDKRNRLEAELAQYRRQALQQPQEQPQIPDPVDDPAGFAAFQRHIVAEETFKTNLYWSKRTAEIQHGSETVAKAYEWGVSRCDTDPFFNQRIRASQDPIGLVVDEWRRDQIASQVTPDDYQAFLQWKASQGQPEPQAPVPAPAPVAAPAAIQQPQTPPRSLAAVPNAGGTRPGEQPVGPGVAFGEVFGP